MRGDREMMDDRRGCRRGKRKRGCGEICTSRSGLRLGSCTRTVGSPRTTQWMTGRVEAAPRGDEEGSAEGSRLGIL